MELILFAAMRINVTGRQSFRRAAWVATAIRLRHPGRAIYRR